MTLFVLLGPTAVGKTALALEIASLLKCPILNCDSRQIYKGMKIGTAAPTKEEQQRVKHYFVDILALDEYYSAAKYEEEAIQLIESLSSSHCNILLTGGSMMYIDAVCKGIDDIPTVDGEIRKQLKERYEREGIAHLLKELSIIDPTYYNEVDHKNFKRIIHALEICHTSGKPYSSFRKKTVKERPFHIVKIGLRRERQELFDRINQRAEEMMKSGFLAEAKSLLPYQDYNSLNTVGYKELFKHLNGEWSLEMAVERIKKNTRVYAKKQMTWFQHDPDIHWFHADSKEEILKFIQENMQ